jgi:hypothetical protein
MDICCTVVSVGENKGRSKRMVVVLKSVTVFN